MKGDSMKHLFKVGDEVTIREWDDLLNEFGFATDDNAIKVPFLFTNPMRIFCGKRAKINAITISHARDTGRYSLTFDGNISSCHFGHAMFEENKPGHISNFKKFNKKFQKENERRFDETLI